MEGKLLASPPSRGLFRKSLGGGGEGEEPMYRGNRTGIGVYLLGGTGLLPQSDKSY